jgi:hypothetical protein
MYAIHMTRSGTSLGATADKPCFIFGDQKRKGELDFEKNNLLGERRQFNGQIGVLNELFKNVACFNVHDNEKHEIIGTAFC